MITMDFIFASSVEAISVQETKINCPYPINSGVGNLTAVQNNFPPVVNYTITYDGTNSTDYHVTIFICGEDPITHQPNASTKVYTGSNNWFDVAGKANGYLFYISESITAFFQKVAAVGTMLYLLIFAPAQVSGLSFFLYIQVFLFALVAIGAFMMIRGSG